jgi:hypothetical protein
MYGLTGSAQEDTDMDGLADYMEYLVSEVFKFGDISPLLAKSNGKEFDYFRKAGKLYLGELFSDHDFMEDHLEREYSEIGAQPAYYDAQLDSNENGWSNWAEIRAKYDMGYGINETGEVRTNLVTQSFVYYTDYESRMKELVEHKDDCIVLDTDFAVTGYGYWAGGEWFDDFWGSGYVKYKKMTPIYAKTYAYNGQPEPEVTMTVHYKGASDIANAPLIIEAYTDGELKVADAVAEVNNGPNRDVNTITFKYDFTSGYLREGKNMFVVTVGASNTTTAASGMIMGIARNVDVGWKKVEFDVELLDESPICPRPTLVYSTGEENTDGNSSNNSSAETTEATSSHVYVYRYAVDEYKPPSSLVNRLILNKEISGRDYLHEGDFLANGGYDIDWANFQDEVVYNQTVYGEGFPVTSVTYRVYSQPVNIANEAQAVSNITPYLEFTREFGATRATAVPVAPGTGGATIFYGARPTFSWSMTGDRPDTYTAFAIQVRDDEGTVIWNSGTQLAPPRNESGNYEWTAPLYVGDQTTSGKVFANDANYSWRVTMYNSKYQDAAWSAARDFRMNVYGTTEPNNADRHRINVAVKYFGPGAINTSTSKTEGSIRVEAFTSPDFSGNPAGRAFVRNAASVTDTNHVVNATIIGLEPGTYYVRAYLDSTGNFIRNDWESWGYACPRGDTATGAIYAPTAFEIGDGKETPTALVYIEDCDKDQDCLPDVWEYDKTGGGSNWLTTYGPMDNEHNGYISVNPNLQASISDLISGGNSITLMSAGPSQMPKALAALMLGVDTVDPSLDARTLSIKALTLAGGDVTLSLSAEAEDPAAGTVFVTDGMVRATVVVKYADSLDGEWKSVEKTLEKKVEDGAVSEELTFSLEELGLDASKGFFKVELKQ